MPGGAGMLYAKDVHVKPATSNSHLPAWEEPELEVTGVLWIQS